MRGLKSSWSAGGAAGRLSPRAAIWLPFGLLTAIFAGLVIAYVEAGTGSSLSWRPILAVISLYAVAVVSTVPLAMAQISRLESLSLTDSLTGGANRRALHKDIDELDPHQREIALALLDLDGFKSINDLYGHFVGDRVIKEVAGLLEELCGAEGKVYRLSGDEFAIVIHGQISANILEGICRRMLDRFAMPIQIDERAIVIGASVGLTRCGRDQAISSSELLRRADMAMYVSKEAGKMRCTWFSEEFDRRREVQRKIDIELREALVNGEFELHYQPVVSAANRRIVAVEALIRWNRTQEPPIGPDQFIPIAEQSGFITTIGLWVLERACRDALQWDDIKVAVNVSAAQLRNPEFPLGLGHILEETGFPPERLELEVTETYLVVDPTVASRNLALLKQFGVSIVLDDFGTGYASIGFLRQFPFEKLKIDRSLIVESATDEGSRAMMVSSIAVARALNMQVTAEGVETEAQAALARIAGCDQLQGWLYYSSINAGEVKRLLDQQRELAPSSNDKVERAA